MVAGAGDVPTIQRAQSGPGLDALVLQVGPVFLLPVVACRPGVQRPLLVRQLGRRPGLVPQPRDLLEQFAALLASLLDQLLLPGTAGLERIELAAGGRVAACGRWLSAGCLWPRRPYCRRRPACGRRRSKSGRRAPWDDRRPVPRCPCKRARRPAGHRSRPRTCRERGDPPAARRSDRRRPAKRGPWGRRVRSARPAGSPAARRGSAGSPRSRRCARSLGRWRRPPRRARHPRREKPRRRSRLSGHRPARPSARARARSCVHVPARGDPRARRGTARRPSRRPAEAVDIAVVGAHVDPAADHRWRQTDRSAGDLRPADPAGGRVQAVDLVVGRRAEKDPFRRRRPPGRRRRSTPGSARGGCPRRTVPIFAAQAALPVKGAFRPRKRDCPLPTCPTRGGRKSRPIDPARRKRRSDRLRGGLAPGHVVPVSRPVFPAEAGGGGECEGNRNE